MGVHEIVYYDMRNADGDAQHEDEAAVSEA
jgi:hypothetical protein